MSLDFDALLDKFEETKRELGDTLYTIKRLTGRDPGFSNGGGVPGSKFRQSSSVPYAGRKRSFPPNTFSSGFDNEREVEDDEEDDEKKPVLASTVVASAGADLKRSRRAAIEEGNKNSKIKARNRRLFSALLASTLEKFKHEEKKRSEKCAMRAEIELKVEVATLEEKERIKKEKEALYATCKEKKIVLRSLEKKIERAESNAVYEKNLRFMEKFIKTKAKPHVFFGPATHTNSTRKYLEESRSKIQELIKERKKCLQKDIAEIEECYRRDSQPGDKENAYPKDESESQDVPESESESLVVEQDTGLENDDSDGKNVEPANTDQDFEPIYD